MKKEIWKKLKNYDYEVSNFGNLRSMDRFVLFSDKRIREYKGKNIKYKRDRDGYFVYPFRNNGKSKYLKIHRLVAELFIPNIFNLPDINHKNGIKNDNNIENLEWISKKDNIKHARLLGLYKSSKGEKIYQYDKDMNFIKEWENSSEVERILNINRTSIRKCVLNYKNHNTAGGFIWKNFK